MAASGAGVSVAKFLPKNFSNIFKAVAFDFDNTLTNTHQFSVTSRGRAGSITAEQFVNLPFLQRLLAQLKEAGVQTGLATYSFAKHYVHSNEVKADQNAQETHVVDTVLKNNQLHFDRVVGVPTNESDASRSKPAMLLAMFPLVEPSSILFFDDDKSNVDDCKVEGITAIHVARSSTMPQPPERLGTLGFTQDVWYKVVECLLLQPTLQNPLTKDQQSLFFQCTAETENGRLGASAGKGGGPIEEEKWRGKIYNQLNGVVIQEDEEELDDASSDGTYSGTHPTRVDRREDMPITMQEIKLTMTSLDTVWTQMPPIVVKGSLINLGDSMTTKEMLSILPAIRDQNDLSAYVMKHAKSDEENFSSLQQTLTTMYDKAKSLGASIQRTNLEYQMFDITKAKNTPIKLNDTEDNIGDTTVLLRQFAVDSNTTLIPVCNSGVNRSQIMRHVLAAVARAVNCAHMWKKPPVLVEPPHGAINGFDPYPDSSSDLMYLLDVDSTEGDEYTNGLGFQFASGYNRQKRFGSEFAQTHAPKTGQHQLDDDKQQVREANAATREHMDRTLFNPDYLRCCSLTADIVAKAKDIDEEAQGSADDTRTEDDAKNAWKVEARRLNHWLAPRRIVYVCFASSAVTVTQRLIENANKKQRGKKPLSNVTILWLPFEDPMSATSQLVQNVLDTGEDDQQKDVLRQKAAAQIFLRVFNRYAHLIVPKLTTDRHYMRLVRALDGVCVGLVRFYRRQRKVFMQKMRSTASVLDQDYVKRSFEELKQQIDRVTLRVEAHFKQTIPNLTETLIQGAALSYFGSKFQGDGGKNDSTHPNQPCDCVQATAGLRKVAAKNPQYQALLRRQKIQRKASNPKTTKQIAQQRKEAAEAQLELQKAEEAQKKQAAEAAKQKQEEEAALKRQADEAAILQLTHDPITGRALKQDYDTYKINYSRLFGHRDPQKYCLYTALAYMPPSSGEELTHKYLQNYWRMHMRSLIRNLTECLREQYVKVPPTLTEVAGIRSSSETLHKVRRVLGTSVASTGHSPRPPRISLKTWTHIDEDIPTIRSPVQLLPGDILVPICPNGRHLSQIAYIAFQVLGGVANVAFGSDPRHHVSVEWPHGTDDKMDPGRIPHAIWGNTNDYYTHLRNDVRDRYLWEPFDAFLASLGNVRQNVYGIDLEQSPTIPGLPMLDKPKTQSEYSTDEKMKLIKQRTNRLQFFNETLWNPDYLRRVHMKPSARVVYVQILFNPSDPPKVIERMQQQVQEQTSAKAVTNTSVVTIFINDLLHKSKEESKSTGFGIIDFIMHQYMRVFYRSFKPTITPEQKMKVLASASALYDKIQRQLPPDGKESDCAENVKDLKTIVEHTTAAPSTASALVDAIDNMYLGDGGKTYLKDNPRIVET